VSERSHSTLKRTIGAGLVLGGMTVGVYALAGAPAQSNPVSNATTSCLSWNGGTTCTNNQTVVGITTTGNTLGNTLVGGTIGNIIKSQPKAPTNNTQTVVGITTTGNTAGNTVAGGTFGNILGKR
jgi:hypothetical protein